MVSVFLIITSYYNTSSIFNRSLPLSNSVNILLLNKLNRYHPILFYISLNYTLNTLFKSTTYYKNFNYSYIYIILLFTMLLGSWWAYQEGSWGGWWDWDASEVLILIVLYFLLIPQHSINHTFNSFWLYKYIKLINFYYLILMYLILQLGLAFVSHNFGIFVSTSLLVIPYQYIIFNIVIFISFYYLYYNQFNLYLYSLLNTKSINSLHVRFTYIYLVKLIISSLIILVIVFSFSTLILPIFQSIISKFTFLFSYDIYNYVSLSIVITYLMFTLSYLKITYCFILLIHILFFNLFYVSLLNIVIFSISLNLLYKYIYTSKSVVYFYNIHTYIYTFFLYSTLTSFLNINESFMTLNFNSNTLSLINYYTLDLFNLINLKLGNNLNSYSNTIYFTSNFWSDQIPFNNFINIFNSDIITQIKLNHYHRLLNFIERSELYGSNILLIWITLLIFLLKLIKLNKNLIKIKF